MLKSLRCWVFHQRHRKVKFRDLDMNKCRVHCGACGRQFVTTLTRFPKELRTAIRAASSNR